MVIPQVEIQVTTCSDNTDSRENVIKNDAQIPKSLGENWAEEEHLTTIPLKPTAVYVEPFIHQVGGHQSVLCWDNTTVCKPYSEKEHVIYEHIPDSLRGFVPAYRGLFCTVNYNDF